MVADTDIRLGTPAGRGILFAAVLGSSVALLDGTVVNIALPHIGRELKSELDGLQWIINGYTLMLAAVVLLGGALGDRFGRRRVFLIGVVWFGVASLLCGLAPNIVTLVAARLFQGIGAGLLTPGSLAIIQASLRKEERAKAIGAWSGLGGVAAAAGPFIGGWLVDALDWRWVFLINVPLIIVCFWATRRWVPESRDTTATGRFDLAGSSLAAIFLGGLTFALVQQGAAALIATVVAVVSGVAFVIVERRTSSPVVPGSMFADRQFTSINVVTFFVYAALSGVMFFLVMQLQVVSGYSPLEAGITMLPFTLLMLAFSAKAGDLGERIGPRWPLAVGSTLAAAGVFMLIGVGANAPYLTAVLPGVLLLSIGMTIVVAPLTAGVLAATDVAHAGVASGINNAIARAAGLIAVAALPMLAGLRGDAYNNPLAFGLGYQIAVAICAGLLLLAGIISVTTVRDRLRAGAEPATHTSCPYNAPQLDPGAEPDLR